MLNTEFIYQKIALIRQDLEFLDKMTNLSFEEVAKDFYKYNTVQMLLMKIIGRAIDINEHLIDELANAETKSPGTYRETFLQLADLKILPADFASEIAKSAGFRNAIVHEYDKLDDFIIYKTIGEAVVQYTKYCHYVLDLISRKS